MAGNTAYDLENSDHVWSIRERAKSFACERAELKREKITLYTVCIYLVFTLKYRISVQLQTMIFCPFNFGIISNGLQLA